MDAMRRGMRSTRWRRSGVTALVVSAALGLVGNLAANTVQLKGWWPWVAWTAVDVLLLVAILIEWTRGRNRVTALVSGDRLERVTAALADEVRYQWAQEAAYRQVFQPVPLKVRWSSTGRPVSASRNVVLEDGSGADWRELPMAGDAQEIVEAFRGLPHRQLVILGEAGAGKTVLSMLLTLGLLKARKPGESVPVLLPIASWDPTAEEPGEFVARRLREEHDFLAASGSGGRDFAELLVTQGRITPILDGLDELPIEWHSVAVEALDRHAAAGLALVVTCRATEYEQAVAGSGLVLSRAAVLEIEPVDVERVIAFLSHPAPGRIRWQPVFEHLRKEPQGVLAEVFSRPLMVALARTAYRSPAADPASLLGHVEVNAIAGSLIDGFVNSVYRVHQPGASGPGSHPLRAYAPDRAARWLDCLAYHLYRAGARDLWWWDLRPDLLVRRSSWGRLLVPVLIALFVISGGFGLGLASGGRTAVYGAVIGAVAAFVSETGIFRSLWPSGYPPYVLANSRWLFTRDRFSELLGRPFSRGGSRLTLAFFGSLWGMMIAVMTVSSPSAYVRILVLIYPLLGGLIGALVPNLLVPMGFGVIFGSLTGALMDAPLLGLVGGSACGLIAAKMPSISFPSRRRRSSARATVRTNYRNAVVAGAQYGLTGGLVFLIAARVVAQPSNAVSAALTAGLVYALAAAFGAGLWVWAQFRLTHMLLASAGWLPWRLWTFLDDAHERGVLRRAGTAWQFRHVLLQNHLGRRIQLEQTRIRAEAGDRDAAWQMAAEMAQQGQVENAIAIWQPFVESDNYSARGLMAQLLARAGREEELRSRAQAGDKEAARKLADLLVGRTRSPSGWSTGCPGTGGRRPGPAAAWRWRCRCRWTAWPGSARCSASRWPRSPAPTAAACRTC